MSNEHIVFSSLIDHLSSAEADCRALAALRDDARWLQVAARFALAKDKMYELVGQGAVRS